MHTQAPANATQHSPNTDSERDTAPASATTPSLKDPASAAGHARACFPTSRRHRTTEGATTRPAGREQPTRPAGLSTTPTRGATPRPLRTTEGTTAPRTGREQPTHTAESAGRRADPQRNAVPTPGNRKHDHPTGRPTDAPRRADRQAAPERDVAPTPDDRRHDRPTRRPPGAPRRAGRQAEPERNAASTPTPRAWGTAGRSEPLSGRPRHRGRRPFPAGIRPPRRPLRFDVGDAADGAVR